MPKPFIIGICGGSASGKTFFLKSLMQEFNKESLCLISQDEYYKTQDLIPTDSKGIANYDSPFAIDIEQFSRDLENLKAGKEVQKLEYTFNNPQLQPKMLTFTPAPIILVEGIFVFYHPEIAEQLDLKIFLDAKEHIKLRRRLKRDKAERGYEMEDVMYRYEYHIAPTYEKYIKPFKSDADLIISNNKNFDKALEILIVYLKSRMEL